MTLTITNKAFVNESSLAIVVMMKMSTDQLKSIIYSNVFFSLSFVKIKIKSLKKKLPCDDKHDENTLTDTSVCGPRTVHKSIS
jgi:hypothetical protein